MQKKTKNKSEKLKKINKTTKPSKERNVQRNC